jgi:UDP-N-acetylglucosamine--N-acetylmuramyl-(pentapeptide) pyrophosphoryl-undecaprenol N-acetylglucosamine transferase
MRVIISGGGTGGHIYPAIAIADAVVNNWSEAKVRFVGAAGRMEMKKVPGAGYAIDGLWISGLQRKRSLKNLLLPLKIIHSLWKCFWILRSFKPNIAVGVGGYASGPLLYMASLMGIPTIIQEQNSFPGITNRMLAKRVDRICVAFTGMERFFDKDKIVLTGNPLRNFTQNIGSESEALTHFNLEKERKTILIVGGSLGSLTMNQAMASNTEHFDKMKDVQIIWQIGNFYFKRFKDCATAQLPNVCPLEYVERMDLAYDLADIVVCRAGALTLSELALCGKAAILVPSPNVSEDHQTKNAMALVESDAARIIEDKDLVEKLPSAVRTLISDEDSLDKLRSNISEMAKPNAVDDIISIIKDLTS